MQRSVPFLPKLATALVACSASAYAPAVEPGVYSCTVEHAVALTRDGRHLAVRDAPGVVVFRASESPVSPEGLQREARPALDSVRPVRGTRSAVLEPALFATATNALRSVDARVYVQGGVVWSVEPEGEFLAYGPARAEISDGVVQYTGRCVAAHRARAPDAP